MSSLRIEIASKVLAGFAANNAVFAHNDSCGWSLVNVTNEQIASYSLLLADILIEAAKVTENPKLQSP